MATLETIDAITIDPVVLAKLRAGIGKLAEYIVGTETPNVANHQSRVEAAGALLRDRSRMVALAERMALRAAQNTDIQSAYVSGGSGASVPDSLIEFIVGFLWDMYAPSVIAT